MVQLHKPHLTRKEAHRVVIVVTCVMVGFEAFCCHGFITQRQLLEAAGIMGAWCKDFLKALVEALSREENE